MPTKQVRAGGALVRGGEQVGDEQVRVLMHELDHLRTATLRALPLCRISIGASEVISAR